MDFVDKVVITSIYIVLGLSVFTLLSLPFIIYYDSKHVEQMNAECNMKGGTLLDHTYRSGKVTHHNYVCVDPKVIIPLQGDE